MNLVRASLLSAVFAASALVAQPTPQCYFVPDADATAGTCNSFPFGGGPFTYQTLLPASFLGGAGWITSIGFAPCSTGTRTLTNVRVRIGHTSAATLSTTFASNLNAPAGGVEVLNRASLAWNLTANTWTALPLDRGFSYNGVNNLVVEIRMDGSSGVSGAFHRSATIERAYDNTSGSSTTATASDLAALKVQVCFGTYYHSPDNTPTTGTCNVFPLEQTSMAYQQLIPASDLGGPGLIRNIGFAPCFAGSQSYSNISVRMAHTTASTLDVTFANNLQAPAGGVSVLSGAHTYNYPTANDWNNLGLTGAFAYNGVDNLVVEIRVDGGTSTGGHHRTNNRARVFAAASGATIATGTDQSALKIRLCVECPRRVVVFSPFTDGCGPVGSGLGIGADTATRGVLGETFNLLMRFGPNGGPGVFVVGATNGFPYPLPIPGAPGCFLRNDILLTLNTGFDGAGNAFPVPFRTPFETRLCGLTLYYQGAAVWPGINPLGIATSNQLILTFGQP